MGDGCSHLEALGEFPMELYLATLHHEQEQAMSRALGQAGELQGVCKDLAAGDGMALCGD